MAYSDNKASHSPRTEWKLGPVSIAVCQQWQYLHKNDQNSNLEWHVSNSLGCFRYVACKGHLRSAINLHLVFMNFTAEVVRNMTLTYKRLRIHYANHSGVVIKTLSRLNWSKLLSKFFKVMYFAFWTKMVLRWLILIIADWTGFRLFESRLFVRFIRYNHFSFLILMHHCILDTS